MFQQFTNLVIGGNKNTKFLPWFNNENGNLPEIDQQHSPYQVLCGEVCLQNFLGPYNRNKSRLYGRVKVRTTKKR